MITKLVKSYSFLVLVSFAMAACTVEDADQNERVLLTVQATAESFSSTASTRTVEVETVTQFEYGDRMGIFAVKNGAIVDGISNIELTYLGQNKWSEVSSSKLYYTAGVTYYAYAPYKEGVVFDPAKTLDANVADWTTEGGKFALSTDQSTKEKYVAADLMTAQATTSTTTLTMTFEHRMALLILYPTTTTTPYVAPAGANYSYKTEGEAMDLEVSDVKVNDVIPRKMEDGTYRAVVPPGSTQLKGDYTITDGGAPRILTASALLSSGFVKKKSYLLKTKHAYNTSLGQERTVQVGDFFYRNNEIVPNDALTPPITDCVGIVGALYAENWKGIVLQNASYTTGVVVALKDAAMSNYNNAMGTALDNYKLATPAPTSSSGWYLSPWQELQFICSGVPDTGPNLILGAVRRDFLEKRLALVGGAAWGHGTGSGSTGNRPTYISNTGMYVFFANGNATSGWYTSDTFQVRYTFAF